MLDILQSGEGVLKYAIRGTLDKKDLLKYYRELDRNYRQNGRVKLTITVQNFRGYTGATALLTFLIHEPALLRKVRSYEVTANQPWFRTLIQAISLPIWWIEYTVHRPPG